MLKQLTPINVNVISKVFIRITDQRVVLAVALVLQTLISWYWLWEIPAGDESIHIYNAYRVAGAQWPYKDFFSYVTPGTYLLGGMALSLFGGKIIVLRVMMLLMALATIILVYKIANKYVKVPHFRSLLIIVYVSVTASSATYFSHHNIDNFLFAVILYIALNANESKRWLLWLGLAVGVDSLVNQVHGFYYFTAVVLYLVFFSGQDRKIVTQQLLSFVLPIVAVHSVFFGALVLSGSFGAFFSDAILWNLTSYKNNLAFGPFEDNVFFLQNHYNAAEQILLILTKIGIIASTAYLFYRLFVVRDIHSMGRAMSLGGLIVLAFGLGHVQTLHNAVSYYILFFLALYLFMCKESNRWVLYVLVICTSIQVLRVVSFPVRHYQDYVRTQQQLVQIRNSDVRRSPQAESINEIIDVIYSMGIERAIVVGRSPEIYCLAGIDNPTRYDVILPRYLTEAQLEDVVAEIDDNIVIYDRILEKIRQSDDFFDTHHYKKTPSIWKEMQDANLFERMRDKKSIYETARFVIYD